LQVENQIRAMQDAKSKNEEVARANLEARKEEYELSKKIDGRATQGGRGQWRRAKGPKNVETKARCWI
jgi:hypothetical protein